MRNLVGVLAIFLSLLFIVTSPAQAGKNFDAKKYGIELQIGGSYLAMQDVNDFIPDAGFVNPAYMGTANDKIEIGTQLGIGFTYRQMHDFGWSFGYNWLMAGIPGIFDQIHRVNAYYPSGGGAESWSEQTVSGGELYIAPFWLWRWGNKDINLTIGPAIYRASLDRSISITRSVGSPNPAGSFEEASGTSLGFFGSVGLDIPIKNNYFLSIQAGGRLAKVTELTYKDNQGVEQTVWQNSSGNATFGVDFTGVFLKLGVKTYFLPDSDWRSPKQ